MMDLANVDKKLMAFFRELSPRERRLMLDELKRTGEIDEATGEFCDRLYEIRYSDPKDPQHRVDNWLWKIVYLPGLYKKKGLLKRAVSNEYKSAVRDLNLEDIDSLDDNEKLCLYLEFRNAAKRYLSTCEGANYASRLMGFRKATPEEKKEKACEDIWMSSRGLVRAYEKINGGSGEGDRLELWCRALRDELFQYDPAAKFHYEELENRQTK